MLSSPRGHSGRSGRDTFSSPPHLVVVARDLFGRLIRNTQRGSAASGFPVSTFLLILHFDIVTDVALSVLRHSPGAPQP